MKNFISRSGSVLIVLAIGVWVVLGINSCGSLKREKEKVETEKKIRIKQAITDMIARHNAVNDWERNLREKFISMLTKVYSIQVEQALVRKDGRPILLFASVEDVARQDNKYFGHFHNWFGLGPNIHFVLECKPDQIKKVMEQSASQFEQYAVVALISSIQRPKFEPGAYSENGEGQEITIESSNIFIAKGRCVDLLFVGQYEPEGQ